jgi:hypothetical protein
MKIKILFEGGLEVSDIAKLLNIRYNFAYNVLQNHVIRNDIPVEKSARNTYRAPVLELLKQGTKLVDIARQTKLNYNYIWKIAKEEGFTGKQIDTATKVEITVAPAPAPKAEAKTHNKKSAAAAK